RGGRDRRRPVVARRAAVRLLVSGARRDAPPALAGAPGRGLVAGRGARLARSRGGLRLRQDGGGGPGGPEGGAGLVDVCAPRGGRADEQRGGAGAAPGGVAPEALVRQPQRGGVPLCESVAERGADAEAARPFGLGVPAAGVGGASSWAAHPQRLSRQPNHLSGYGQGYGVGDGITHVGRGVIDRLDDLQVGLLRRLGGGGAVVARV